MDFIKSLFEVIMLPCLSILFVYVIQLIKIKLNQIEVSADKELYQTYLQDALDAICKGVIAVNQTYVDNLKATNSFTDEAQSEAFRKACQIALELMGEEKVAYLDKMMDNFELWMQVQIEAAVNKNK